MYRDGSLKQQNFSSLGITQITEFNILPNIDSYIANIIVVTFSLLFVSKSLIWDMHCKLDKSKKNQFLKYLIISSLIFFNFGYQVHEKAFIKTSILAILFYIFSSSDCNTESEKVKLDEKEKTYNSFLSFTINLIISVGVFAQMPLIHSIKDYSLKLIIVLFYLMLSRLIIKYLNKSKCSKRFPGLNQIIYIFTLVCLTLDFIITFSPHMNIALFNQNDFLNSQLLQSLYNLKEKYQFLPLMTFSVINAVITQFIFIMIFFLKED